MISLKFLRRNETVMRWICNDWMIQFLPRPTSFIGIVEALLFAYTITRTHIAIHIKGLILSWCWTSLILLLVPLSPSLAATTLRDLRSLWFFSHSHMHRVDNSNNRPDERGLRTRNCNQLLCFYFLPCNTWVLTNGAAINLSVYMQKWYLCMLLIARE
jgi:hypothetical protein